MKKLFLSMTLLGALVITNVNAQGILGKIKNAVKSDNGGGGGNSQTVTTTDEWGLSGNYDMSSPWVYYGDKIKKMGVEFVKEENGTIVNRFTLLFNKSEKEVFEFDEKLFNKQGIKLFRGHLDHKACDIMQLDKDVLFLNCTDEKGYLVLAKDKELLKTWDEETGLAKYEAEKKKVNAVASAGLRKKLEDFKAYKENVGKVVFARAQGAFENRKDDASENPANFQTEWVTGNGLAMKAYFDKSIDEVCPECGGAYNVVFEMGKEKVDWMQIRSSSSAFSKLHAPKVLFGSQYMAQSWLWDDYDFNRAMTMAIHKNITSGALKAGQSMSMKLTIYTYKDKTNGTKMAEGSISVKYDPSSSNWTDRYNPFKDAVE